MKKMFFSAVMIGSGLAFTTAAVYADQNDDVLARVEALKKENAAIKKENAALRENKALLEQKAALKSAPQAASPRGGVCTGFERAADRSSCEGDLCDGHYPF